MASSTDTKMIFCRLNLCTSHPSWGSLNFPQGLWASRAEPMLLGGGGVDGIGIKQWISKWSACKVVVSDQQQQQQVRKGDCCPRPCQPAFCVSPVRSWPLLNLGNTGLGKDQIRERPRKARRNAKLLEGGRVAWGPWVPFIAEAAAVAE